MTLADVFRRRSDGSPEAATPVPPPVRPSVAEQVATLARLGLPAQGVSALDIGQDRDAALLVRRHPYAAALHCLARDASGELTHHPRVATVDLEHLAGPGSWTHLMSDLAAAAGTTALLGPVGARADEEHGRWVLRFTVGGLTREVHPRLDHGRLDPHVLDELAQAVAGPAQGAALVRHGQTVTVAYVPRRHAGELQRVLDRWASLA